MDIFFKNILSTLYQYYNKGATQSIAYNCALSGFLIVFYLNFMTLLALLKIDSIFNHFEYVPRVYKYFIFFILIAPFFFFLKKKYPEKRIKHYKSNLNYKLGITMFFAYVICSFIAFIIVFSTRQKI